MKLRCKQRAWGTLLIFMLIVPLALSACGGFSSFPYPENSQLRKTPYLIYPGNNNSMTVVWQTNKTCMRSMIEWGSTPNCEEGEAEVLENGRGQEDHQFSYAIHNLIPGKRTFYKVMVEDQSFTGSFLTAPDESATSLSFYAYGDTRSHPDIHNALVSKLLSDLGSSPDTRQTFCLHTGDFVTYGLDEIYWDKEFFNIIFSDTLRFLSGLPILGCVGNHELYSTTSEQEKGGKLFRKYWPNPLLPDPEHFYYSFDYGPVHIAVLDTATAEYKEGSAQWNWLQQDLANSKKPWKTCGRG